MGYQTGVASTVSDLLTAIQTFAAADGWTINSGKSARSDAVAGECVNITRGDVAAAFYSKTSGATATDPGHFMGTYQYPSYSGGNGNMAQNNAGTKTLTNGMGAGPFVAYHFFGGPNCLHVVVETVSGTYKHFGVGQVEKAGEVTTGVYNTASRWDYGSTTVANVDSQSHAIPFDSFEGSAAGASTVVRADSDSQSPRYFNPTHASNPLLCGWRSTSAAMLSLPIKSLPPSTMTGRAVLWPLMLSVFRGSGMYSPIGYVPDVRAVRIDNLTPGQALTIGSDTWRVFPVIRKNGTAGDVNSANYGFAYLQRP